MKSIVYTLTLTTSLVAGIVLVSCKSKKEAATVTVKDTGFKKVESVEEINIAEPIVVWQESTPTEK